MQRSLHICGLVSYETRFLDTEVTSVKFWGFQADHASARPDVANNHKDPCRRLTMCRKVGSYYQTRDSHRQWMSRSSKATVRVPADRPCT